jgi:hypothetical protein
MMATSYSRNTQLPITSAAENLYLFYYLADLSQLPTLISLSMSTLTLGPSQSPFNAYPCYFPWGQNGRGIKLITYLYLATTLKITGAISQNPHIPLWRAKEQLFFCFLINSYSSHFFKNINCSFHNFAIFVIAYVKNKFEKIFIIYHREKV